MLVEANSSSPLILLRDGSPVERLNMVNRPERPPPLKVQANSPSQHIILRDGPVSNGRTLCLETQAKTAKPPMTAQVDIGEHVHQRSGCFFFFFSGAAYGAQVMTRTSPSPVLSVWVSWDAGRRCLPPPRLGSPLFMPLCSLMLLNHGYKHGKSQWTNTDR